MADPYEVLGVSPDATPDEVRRAYKAAARRWHPDRNPDPGAAEQFRAVAAAWAVLSDPTKRRDHDRRARRGAAPLADPAFVDAVATAIERAQDYAERVVVPHFASRFRGRGAEMGGEALRDLRRLGDPSWLQPQITRAGRRRAAGWLAGIRVGWGERSTEVTELLRLPKGWLIRVSPAALWAGGIRASTDVDDVVLRLVVARYAQILAQGRFWPPAGDEDVDWAAALAQARDVDDAEVRRWWTWAAVWSAVALLVAFMLYSGLSNR